MALQTILFPSSYFKVNKVDEDLQKEYDAVKNTGLYDICLRKLSRQPLPKFCTQNTGIFPALFTPSITRNWQTAAGRS